MCKQTVGKISFGGGNIGGCVCASPKCKYCNGDSAQLRRYPYEVKMQKIPRYESETTKKPHKCPVCDGSGKFCLSTGFPLPLAKLYSDNEKIDIQPGVTLTQKKSFDCHVCKGVGVLWG